MIDKIYTLFSSVPSVSSVSAHIKRQTSARYDMVQPDHVGHPYSSPPPRWRSLLPISTSPSG